MSSRRHAVVLGLLAAMAHQAVLAQDASSKLLMEQGQYWQALGNQERAGEAWNKLLLIDPEQPQALYGLALLDLSRQNMTGARAYLARLKKNPNGLYAAKLEQDIALRSPEGAKAFEAARIFAQQGELDKAIAQYNIALGGRDAHGQVGLEYYGYLGYSSKGWEASRRGFERLQKEDPTNLEVQVDYAKLLTRNETTRQQGIELLARLSTKPGVGGAATEGWRQGLTWLGTPRASEKPMFEAYLKANPQDTEIRDQMNSIVAQSTVATRAPAIEMEPKFVAGMAALERGDQAKAEAEFMARLKTNPTDPDALGGLGLVRMQQGRMVESRDLLTLATLQKNGAGWQGALNAIKYQEVVAQGRDAQRQGDLAGARKLFDRAAKMDPKQTGAESGLADLMAESGDLSGAEKAYRKILTRNKSDQEALVGLVSVLAQQNKPDQARKLVEQATAGKQTEAETTRLRSAYAQGLAKSANRRGDDAAARSALEDAMRYDPKSPWIRLELAQIYLKAGRQKDAQSLVDGLLASEPGNPDALFASASLAAGMGEYQRALDTLDRIPAKNRTAGIAALQKQIWAQAQIATASRLGKAGRKAEAIAILKQLEPTATVENGQLGAVAAAYVDAGDAPYGLNMLRQAMAKTTKPGSNELLQYAGMLLQTNQDAESAVTIRELQARTLTADQKTGLDNLVAMYTVRQAEAARERGDLVAAYDILKPVLEKRPNDPTVVSALARMYVSSGESKKAVELYKPLLERSPENVDLLIGAAQAATSAKDFSYADTQLLTAISLSPENPDVLASAARIYRQQGKMGKAQDLFQRALALQGPVTATNVPQVATNTEKTDAPKDSTNPFVGMPGQRAQATGQSVSGSTPSAAPASAPKLINNYMDPGVKVAAPAATKVEPVAVVTPPSVPVVAAAPAEPVVAVAPVVVVAPVVAPVVAVAPVAPVAPVAAVAPVVKDVPAPKIAAAPERIRITADGPKQVAVAAVPAPVPAPAPTPVPVAPSIVATAPPSSPTPAPVPAPVVAMMPVQTPPVAAPVPAQTTADREPTRIGASAPETAPLTIAGELDQIMQERSGELLVGAQTRNRVGSAGTSQLSAVETPVELILPAGDGKVNLKVTPVFLNAGGLDTSSLYARNTFGSGLVSLDQLNNASSGSNSTAQNGVGISLGYKTTGIDVDAGVTPVGFLYNTFAGGVKFDGGLDDANSLQYLFNISRRPVTDSLLSFAGMRDNNTGAQWGGVSATGARLQLIKDFNGYGIIGAASWHSLDGNNVVSNSRSEVSGGMYWSLIRDTDKQLSTGFNINGIFYDKNLSNFTYGQGGYFSPQNYFSLTLPLSWSQRDQNFTWQVRGAVGVQSIYQASSDYFPGNSDLQNQANNVAASAYALGLTGSPTAQYASSSKVGVSYNIAAAAEYQVAPNWFFGGSAQIDNSNDYRQWGAGLYLHYYFYPITRPMNLPVRPFISPYGQ